MFKRTHAFINVAADCRIIPPACEYSICLVADPEDRAMGEGGLGAVPPAGVQGSEPPLGHLPEAGVLMHSV